MQKYNKKMLVQKLGRGGKTETTSKITASDPEQAKAQAQLRGSVGGVSGILSISDAVSKGITQYSSAVTILKEIFGFNEAIAKQILGSPPE